MNTNNLINPDTYQVLILTSRCTFPFFFATHSYFIVNNKGAIDRWEVLFFKNQCKTSWGYLHLNALGMMQGIQIFPFLGLRWSSKVIGTVEGQVAQQMIEEVQKSPVNYHYNNAYRLWGPNSNSYVAWVIDKFPDCGMKLPLSAIGRRYF